LLRTFGITQEQYEEMFRRQNGRCGICQKRHKPYKNGKGKVRNLSVDHDHETGKVRGLLCNRCNMALGMLGDTQDGLKAALRYLRSHP
jgi:hypothetical protein